MELYSSIQRQIKSNESSPKTQHVPKNHHRTKAVVQNVVFNSLSQNNNKYYTLTVDEDKIKSGSTKMKETIKNSQNQKKLVIEELDEYSDGKQDFMNLKFGKKYYNSRLKNPLFSSDENHCFTGNSSTSIQSPKIENTFEMNKQGNYEKKSEEKNDSITSKRRLSNCKLSKYLEKLKQKNLNINLEDLKSRISQKNSISDSNNNSKNFQKIIFHKFNSNSLLECKTKKQMFYNFNEDNFLQIEGLKNKINHLEKEIISINEKHLKETNEMRNKIDDLETRVRNLEKCFMNK